MCRASPMTLRWAETADALRNSDSPPTSLIMTQLRDYPARCCRREQWTHPRRRPSPHHANLVDEYRAFSLLAVFGEQGGVVFRRPTIKTYPFHQLVSEPSGRRNIGVNEYGS